MKKSIIYIVIIIAILTLLTNIVLICYILNEVRASKEDDILICAGKVQSFNDKFEQFTYVKELSKEQIELILEAVKVNNLYGDSARNVYIEFKENIYNVEATENMQELKEQLYDTEKYNVNYMEYNVETGYIEKIQININTD